MLLLSFSVLPPLRFSGDGRCLGMNLLVQCPWFPSILMAFSEELLPFNCWKFTRMTRYRFCLAAVIHIEKLCCRLVRTADRKVFSKYLKTCVFSYGHGGVISQSCVGWKGPLEIIQFNPPKEAGSLEQVGEKSVQESSEYLQRRRLHSLWAACSSALPPSKEQCFFSCSDGTSIWMFQFVPRALCPLTGHHWKGLDLIHLTPTL